MRCFEKWVCKIEKKKKGFNAKIKMNFYTSYATSLISIHIIQFMIEKCVEFEQFWSKIDSHQSLYNCVNL